MELHMVHINSKYVDAEGNLDGGYATNADGLAVLGLMFDTLYQFVSFSLIINNLKPVRQL